MSTAINRDDWLRALTEAGLTHDGDQDAITATEFGAMFNLKRAAARYKLAQLVEAGKAVPTRKRVADAAGRIVVVPAYRLTA